MSDVAPLLLWATPRTLSTAFERVMIERGDHTVWDEPFSAAYYFGPARRSGRYGLREPEATVEAVTERILGHDGPLFVKDMAYQALPGPPDRLLDACRHSFLIRDPARALVSYARKWPDIDEEEAGYAAQRALFERLTARTGQAPVVVDSDDLRRDPVGTVRAWCAAMGITHRAEALTWEPGMRPEWWRWEGWYDGVARSTRILPPEDGPPPEPGDGRVAALIADCRRHYEVLATHRLDT